MLYTTIIAALATLAPCPRVCGLRDRCIFCNPLKYDNFSELLLALTDGVTIILMPVIVLAIAYIGFRMVLAGKDKNADYTKWKNAFGWSLVGLFLVLGARGILFVIQNTLNDVLGDEYEVNVVE